jgi:hypothetical protein
LNDQCVELTYKEDFHLSAVEYFENTQKSNWFLFLTMDCCQWEQLIYQSLFLYLLN